MTATNDQISYAEFTLTVPANSSIPIERQSDFVACLSSTADFKIRLNNSPSAFFTAGLTVEPIGGLESVQVVNDTATPLTVTLAFGRGNIRDSRVTLNPTQILPTREGPPDVVGQPAAVTTNVSGSTMLLAANPLRSEAILFAEGSSSTTVYLGDNGQGATIKGGDTLVLRTTGAIHVYNPSASATLLFRMNELEWSS